MFLDLAQHRLHFNLVIILWCISVSRLWQIPRKAQRAHWRQRGTTYTQKEDTIIDHWSSSLTFSLFVSISDGLQFFPPYVLFYTTSKLSWLPVSSFEAAFAIHLKHMYLYSWISVKPLNVGLIKGRFACYIFEWPVFDCSVSFSSKPIEVSCLPPPKCMSKHVTFHFFFFLFTASKTCNQHHLLHSSDHPVH